MMHQKVNKEWFHYSSPEKHGDFIWSKATTAEVGRKAA